MDKHSAEPKVQHIPEGIFLTSERLLGKHHDRTGVDRQGQPVVQVHVLQPVVIDLNKKIKNTEGRFLRNVGSLSVLEPSYYFQESRPARNGVKNHYSASLPGETESGRESRVRVGA